MTAEIAIMNKDAVVLAADSAGSVGSKVYNTVNKLFTLSKYHPVGVMIYGNSTIMGVPWETIIKMYRHQLVKNKFSKLEDYAINFIKFLDDNQFFFPEEHQVNYFKISTNICYNNLIKKIKERSNSLRLVCIDDKELNELKESHFLRYSAEKVVKEEENNLKKYIAFVCDEIPQKSIDEVIETYKDSLSEIKSQLFKEIPIDENTSEIIDRIAAYSYFKENITGLVISGFGEKDIFPVLVSYIVTGVIKNKVMIKKNDSKCTEINVNKVAEIFPFAQSHVMDAFLYGIDPGLKSLTKKVFSRIIEEYPEKTFKHFIKMLDLEIEDKELIKKIVEGYESLKKEEKPEFDELLKTFFESASEFNIKPIKDAVGVLPKDEMAAMAESLLNLTSLKQRVSIHDKESVGGSIDVAVISKVDGFVWIKRKHYFDSKLNQQFFNNYFLEDSEDNIFKIFKEKIETLKL